MVSKCLFCCVQVCFLQTIWLSFKTKSIWVGPDKLLPQSKNLMIILKHTTTWHKRLSVPLYLRLFLGLSSITFNTRLVIEFSNRQLKEFLKRQLIFFMTQFLQVIWSKDLVSTIKLTTWWSIFRRQSGIFRTFWKQFSCVFINFLILHLYSLISSIERQNRTLMSTRPKSILWALGWCKCTKFVGTWVKC